MNVAFFASMYGYFFSILIPNLETAMSLTPLLILPLMLMSGMLIDSNTIKIYFKPLEFISFFKYGF